MDQSAMGIDNAFRFHRLAAGFTLALALADLVIGRAVKLHGFAAAALLPGIGASILLLVAIYCHFRKYAALREAALACCWLVQLACWLNIFMQICGRAPTVLVDKQLAALDSAMGLSVFHIALWADRHAALNTCLVLVYNSVDLLIPAAAIVPALQGDFRASQRFLASVTIAALITGGLFVLLPAVGPWVVYGYRATPIQLAAQNYLLALKSPGPVLLDLDVAAIVSFPSFHVVLALLSAAAMWHSRRLRMPLVVVAATICFSTLTTGWHYAIDVLGGFALSPLAWWLAGGIGFIRDPARNTERIMMGDGRISESLSGQGSTNQP